MKMQAFPQPRQNPGEVGVGGLALMAISVAAEVSEGVPAEQAHGFFVAIGRRMADLEPLEGVNDASVLCARINAFWLALDWGEIELAVGKEAIIVRHRDLPNKIVPDHQGNWAAMLLGVLEGAYDSWFRVLGSGPALRTTAEWKGDTLELRHGR
ncbi:cellulose biosynthesis protein BcsD [Novosphingobium sp. BL-52-GroH]|uniref:cellulose biosynthesis protein BcsD n=1 Tax=Novosphingobium sp. BL-52-GroH TaxID=3349877 RepID=UPI00384F248B